MKEQRIFLLGFMGAGKTTLGKKLSSKLNLPFIDVDHFIEKKYKMSISSMFEKFGEGIFRDIETKELQELIKKNTSGVFSVGGGLPCFNDNMDFLNKKGITFYLQHPAKELFFRLKNGKNKRPLLKNLSEEEMLKYIEGKLKDREFYYLQAKFIIERENQLEKIIEILILVATTRS